MITPVIATWTMRPDTAARVNVLPDGCRDVILCAPPGQRPHWFFSPLDRQTRAVAMKAGVFMQGFRLLPGTALDERFVLATLNDGRINPDRVAEILAETAKRDGDVGEALACLASGEKSVASATARLGVSTRSLERVVVDQTGESPSFWLRLARVRLSARALYDSDSIADVACANGYCDQAHMNREFARWFKLSPRRLKSKAAWRRLLDAPAYP